MIAVLVSIACAQTTMVNRTKRPWNAHDKESKAYCEKRCPQLYSDSPCLSKFIKWDKQDYDCICGPKVNKKDTLSTP